MNRKILFLIAGAVIAVAASWNVSRSTSEEALLSDVTLENIEALANENGGSGGCKWKSLRCSKGSGYYEGCLSNGDGNSCSCGTISRDC
jgi:hypothetical protein